MATTTKSARAFFITGCCIALTACTAARADFSADFNSDSVVDGVDFATWNGNKFTNGNSFADGDANGDGYVGYFGDFNVLTCQLFGSPPSGSTAFATGDYDPLTGTVDVTITPDTNLNLGVANVFLVNTTGTIALASAPFLGAGELLGPSQTAPVPFYPPTANSYSEINGLSELLGFVGNASATFNVPIGTPASSLQFFYQRKSMELEPVVITDTLTNLASTPLVLDAFCSCPVPEPSTAALMMLLPLIVIRFRNRAGSEC